MTWLIGIGLGILSVLWLAMELATHSDKGEGYKTYFKAFKNALIFVIPLFTIAGVIYYGFIH
ncbi:hypothetical protein [Halalkalibacter akibai]|uniref:BshB3 potential contributor to bacillithiol synthesis n=1 Tax=Halalkalibacter akibai (strain ATCC 43226 / DSM 21942 / CIP 109018 / JCM 9157 / 1139) TaxID=1236973 RepID=W4QMF8_HALA3|nr:hypothetical protein [Halalkalibacter akibai]GAE33082.1 hypothetical protein JCM9157_69 [Halalkalibacter akibai JCM 9157]